MDLQESRLSNCNWLGKVNSLSIVERLNEFFKDVHTPAIGSSPTARCKISSLKVPMIQSFILWSILFHAKKIILVTIYSDELLKVIVTLGGGDGIDPSRNHPKQCCDLIKFIICDSRFIKLVVLSLTTTKWRALICTTYGYLNGVFVRDIFKFPNYWPWNWGFLNSDCQCSWS